jgi:hypothetical protein
MGDALQHRWNWYGAALAIGGIAVPLVPVLEPWNYIIAGILFIAAIACVVWPHVVSRRNRVERDVWLREAVFFAVHGRWLGENERALGEKGQTDRACDVADEMRQYARDGRLTVWGKEWRASTFDPIPQDYWVAHQIAFLSLLRERQEDTATEKATFDGKGPFYRELMVSRSQVEALWPQRRRTALDRLFHFTSPSSASP